MGIQWTSTIYLKENEGALRPDAFFVLQLLYQPTPPCLPLSEPTQALQKYVPATSRSIVPSSISNSKVAAGPTSLRRLPRRCVSPVTLATENLSFRTLLNERDSRCMPVTNAGGRHIHVGKDAAVVVHVEQPVKTAV